MRRWILAVGAAALAITAPVLAKPDEAKGGGRSDRAGHAAKTERGAAKAEIKAHGRDHVAGGKSAARAEVKVKANGRGNEVKAAKARDFGADDGGIRIVRRNFDGAFAGRGLIDGCPPGLEKKDNGCLPPGHAKELVGARLPDNLAKAMVPFAYRNWYQDNDDYIFRAGDGFIYRVDRDKGLVDGLIPLMGGSYYAAGDPWPQPYNFYNVPSQYQNLWADGGDYAYRFGGDAIYRVDAKSGVVDSIVALLAGDLGVGSRLPAGYDAYNVPFAYRDRYADNSDAWYRYNDGYIYQVDPKTRLVTAVINALI